MRAVYRQLNPFQYNAVEFNPRDVYRLLLGEEPPKPADTERAATASETMEELQHRYLPALQRLSEARLANRPADPADEAAIVEFQQRSVSMLASSSPTPAKHSDITLPPEVFDLGESWRAIHLLLTGKKEIVNNDEGERREGIFGDSFLGRFSKLVPRESSSKNGVFSMAIFGGAEIPAVDSRLDHGPARLLTPEEVRSITAALDKIEPAALIAGYSALDAAGVPAPPASELAQQYTRLRHFYLEAAANGNAVVTCLC